NVWGSDYPYLVSRFCDLDAKYDPNYGKTVQFSSDEIKSRVKDVTGIELTGDPSGWIVIEERLDGNYVGQMSVGGYHSYTDGDGDTLKITGRRFREKIMSFDLRSSSFDVAYDSGSDMFTFTTYGYGHGVGMSQNGANALATYLGYDYKQILTYYYAGTEVK
ncbi:MAG: SpoIID/LytB domain protein, partial [Oscillospiraceae bacterium]